MKTQIEILRSSSTDQGKSIIDMQNELKIMKVQNDEFAVFYEEGHKKIEKLELEKKDFKILISDLEEEMKRVKGELNGEKQKSRNSTTSVDQLLKSIKDLEDENEELNLKLTESKQKLEEMKALKVQLETQNLDRNSL